MLELALAALETPGDARRRLETPGDAQRSMETPGDAGRRQRCSVTLGDARRCSVYRTDLPGSGFEFGCVFTSFGIDLFIILLQQLVLQIGGLLVQIPVGANKI